MSVGILPLSACLWIVPILTPNPSVELSPKRTQDFGGAAVATRGAENGCVLHKAGDGVMESGAEAPNRPSGVVGHTSGLPKDRDVQSLGSGVKEFGRQRHALHGHRDVVGQQH